MGGQASHIILKYLMCDQKLLMPANRSEQSWKEELCQEKDMFRAGRRREEALTDERGGRAGQRERLRPFQKWDF